MPNPQLTITCVALYLNTHYESSGGTIDAPLVDKFEAFAIGPAGEGSAADSNGGAGGPTSTASPPRNGTGGSSYPNYSSMPSGNRAPALTASTMSTYDGDRGSGLSVGTSNLNASTPTPTGSPSNRSGAYSRSDNNNTSGLNATGGSATSLGLTGDRRQSQQGTVPTSIGSSADSLAASPLIFDVSPSSDVSYGRSGGYSTSSGIIASTGGHRRIISTESSQGGLPPPPPPQLERGSSQEVDAFLSSNGNIAPRPFGSATSSHSTGGGSDDGLRGLDALTNGGHNGSAGGSRERAQTMPTPAEGHPSEVSYHGGSSSHHQRNWSTSDQLLGSSLNSQGSASTASRLLSSSEPPKTSYLGGATGIGNGMGVGGRPPLASSKANLSELSASGGSPSSSSYGGHGNFPTQQQQQQQRSTSIGSQQEQYRGSIGAYATSEYSMPEDRAVHGGNAYAPSSSSHSSTGGLSSQAMPQPLNQHARSYSHGSAPTMSMSMGSTAGHRSSGTPLFGASVRERFATSDGIAEHQQQTQYASSQYGGVPSHQQLPRSVSTGSNVLMYATTGGGGNGGGGGGEFSSMRRSDSAPGHIVSSSVPSYHGHYQDQSVHGGSRFSTANRTRSSSSSSSMYGQPQQHQQQHYHSQQPVYHTVEEHHEPIVLPQYGVATMPRPPANSAMGPGPKIVYHVQFKRSHRYFVLGPRAPRDIEVGTFVKVEADRGEDLGKIVDLLSAEHFNANSRNLPTAGAGYGDGQGPGGTCASDLKRITRRATKEEVDLLPLKNEEEMELVKICGDKVLQRGLPMRIVDAEYQFDRHKLTFFFESDCRVDFRELVRDLFSIYKTRIWMEQLN